MPGARLPMEITIPTINLGYIVPVCKAWVGCVQLAELAAVQALLHNQPG